MIQESIACIGYEWVCLKVLQYLFVAINVVDIAGGEGAFRLLGIMMSIDMMEFDLEQLKVSDQSANLLVNWIIVADHVPWVQEH